MVTSTAGGTASPHRPVETGVISIEVAVVATDQAVAPATSIHRLHRAPAVLLPAATGTVPARQLPGATFAALVVPLARRSTTAIAGSGRGVVPPPTPAVAARQIGGGISRRVHISSSSTAATSTTTASSASPAGTVAVDDEVTPITVSHDAFRTRRQERRVLQD